MSLVISLLALLLAIIGSTILSRRFPKIPLAVWQIGVGIACSVLPIPVNLQFQPELFMVIIIAPLLFNEGQHISRSNLRQFAKPIMLLAFGLVFATVFLGGMFIHWLLPAMPLAIAFALAAILSPTDTVALQSVTKGLKLPGNLGAILDGESLFNDASGVVAFKVAIAAALTGVFSIGDATMDFLFVALGGIALGAVLGFIYVWVRLFLRGHGYEEVSMLVVIQFTTPFIVFLVAEALGVSGILAVVAAGIVHGIEKDALQRTTTKLQIISANTWSVLGYVLNGLVFVLLGFMLPDVYQAIETSNEASTWFLALISLAITLGLIVIRFLWVFILYKPFINEARPMKRFVKKVLRSQNLIGESSVSRAKYALIAAFCGIRGTITLATALSIPFTLLDGSAFPMRDSILFLAAGVIIFSLVLAIIFLPLLAEKPVEADSELLGFAAAKKILIDMASRQLESEINDGNRIAIHQVLGGLHQELGEYNGQANFRKASQNKMLDLMRCGYEAELEAVKQLQADDKISEQVAQLYQIYLQKQTEFLQTTFLQRLKINIQLRLFRKRLNHKWDDRVALNGTQLAEEYTPMIVEFKQARKAAKLAAIKAIQEQENIENHAEVERVLQRYNQTLKIDQLDDSNPIEVDTNVDKYYLEAIQVERDMLSRLLETKRISLQTAAQLREHLNYDEMLLVGNELEALE
ncbi:Na+/H+ antiporter [Culicoidibacter larvae]|uniref:Na+/H+ antiporter n=1 Tax=Culicoidibacter larvae TaxID=2579976 RepID=A0A5R8Q6Y1_9FIRM|nr:Na+/H+ antiporter [Culicoidibacter larvae]TLG71103.1 Na+/H+ antiporter [Culicoidibacter larvae]